MVPRNQIFSSSSTDGQFPKNVISFSLVTTLEAIMNMNVVIDKVRWKVCQSKPEEINRRMGNMYVMWGFVLGRRFAPSAMTVTKWRRKRRRDV
jgi:hypothetical protein